MNKHINVTYKVYANNYSIKKALDKLSNSKILSYDCETQSVYSIEEKAEAKELLKCCTDELSTKDRRLSKLVAKSSGLSNPRLVKITHFLFGLSETESVILISNNYKTEVMICDWICNFEGKLLVHNSVFDISLVYSRVHRFPKDLEDTQLLAKTLVNHTQNWHSRVGLKHLMGSHFDPRWTALVETYDIVDYKNPNFLMYCAIDAAATFKLWNQLQEHLDETL